jgi:hypothetical protein
MHRDAQGCPVRRGQNQCTQNVCHATKPVLHDLGEGCHMEEGGTNRPLTSESKSKSLGGGRGPCGPTGPSAVLGFAADAISGCMGLFMGLGMVDVAEYKLVSVSMAPTH